MSWLNFEIPVLFGKRGKPDPAAIVDFSSTTQGVLFPSMTTVDRDAIQNPPDGLHIFNINTHSLEVWDSIKGEWTSAGGAGGISKWLPTTDYEIEDIIWEGEEIYKALSTHTSGTDFATDLANGLWQLMSRRLNATEVRDLYESNADVNRFSDAYKTKLDGIETGATADMTAAEIKAAYESNADTNAFTDSEKSKLALLETSHFRGKFATLTDLQNGVTDPRVGDYAHVDDASSDVIVYTWDDDNSQWVDTGHTQLTSSEVKTLYESNADTNAFTDAEKTKLGDVPTPSEIVKYTGNDTSNVMWIGNIQDQNVMFMRNSSTFLWFDATAIKTNKMLELGAGMYLNSNSNRIQNVGAPVDSNDAATKQYVLDMSKDGDITGYVVGSTTDVTNGKAHFSSIQAAINTVPAGSKILLLNMEYAEDITINKIVTIEGMSYNSKITGATVIDTYGINLSRIYFNGNITLNSTAYSCIITNGWINWAYDVIDNSGSDTNIYMLSKK